MLKLLDPFFEVLFSLQTSLTSSSSSFIAQKRWSIPSARIENQLWQSIGRKSNSDLPSFEFPLRRFRQCHGCEYIWSEECTWLSMGFHIKSKPWTIVEAGLKLGWIRTIVRGLQTGGIYPLSSAINNRSAKGPTQVSSILAYLHNLTKIQHLGQVPVKGQPLQFYHVHDRRWRGTETKCEQHLHTWNIFRPIAKKRNDQRRNLKCKW